MTQRISLILPIYKSERFINKTLASIKVQNFPSLEIIIVNDGTPDNSMEIIDKFFMENPMNHVIINQINQGRTKARNVGFENSHGDYVYFMDSDDFLQPNMLNDMYNSIIKKGCASSLLWVSEGKS